MPLFIGLDVGTQGVRAICCDECGAVVSQSARAFDSDVCVTNLPSGWFEQHPEEWWRKAAETLLELTSKVEQSGRSVFEVAAVSVDSTSGSVIPVDVAGEPLRPAIMYNDARASAEAEACNSICQIVFTASFALPKLIWLRDHEPHVWNRANKVIHAADFIVGRLTGNYTVSDESNALKTGYDVVEGKWPQFIASSLGIDIEKLPLVFMPGTVVAHVSRPAAVQTGLVEGTAVASGVTDGTAGFIAGGACRPGEWNSTLGTTLVIRGVSEKFITDPKGRIYCHRSPDGCWLPGGASNTGAECLVKRFPDVNYAELDSSALAIAPTRLLVYPLVRKGERLPFADPEAEGFVFGDVVSKEELYCAYLEGVAYVERWCFELAEELGAPVGDTVIATGGGANSEEWLKIRASVLHRDLVRPLVSQSAMGSAVLAASQTYFASLAEATRAMVAIDVRVSPEPHLASRYDDYYAAFRQECAARGIGQ